MPKSTTIHLKKTIMEKCYEIAENLLATLGIDGMISFVCSLSDEDILNIINS